MPNITLQYYLTDTLTDIDGISIAIWNSGYTAVTNSGVSDSNGQAVFSLAAGTYYIKSFKTGYTVEDSSVVVGAVAATVTIYADEVPYGAKTFDYYRDIIINNLGGRNDATTLALIMSNFNAVQEFLSVDCTWEDLSISKITTLTDGESEYSFTDLGLTNLNEIYSIRVNDSTDVSNLLGWSTPLSPIAPLDWDTYVAIEYPIVEGVPYRYTRRGGNILFNSTPDDDYVVNIVASLLATPVTSTSSSVDFSGIDTILTDMTTAYTWLSLKENTLYTTFLNKANALLEPFKQKQINKRHVSSQFIGAKRGNLSR